MNLRLHLLARLLAVALLCLLAAIGFVLHDSARQTQAVVQNTAATLSKQFELKLLLFNTGNAGGQPLPDFDLWKQTNNTAGICLSYVSADASAIRNLCNGVALSLYSWPVWFDSLYRRLFNPEFQVAQAIMVNGHRYGVLTVSAGMEMALALAWYNIRNLLGLSVISILAVCVLVYLAISRMLRPAQLIVAGLEQMSNGDLSRRLPDFEVQEWRQTAAAINQLAQNQQLLLSERQKLAVMLMSLQEEERRYLARELHDELGQCLTAIQAVASGMAQTAAQQCPALQDDAERISRFTQAMQHSVQALLTRLRPADIEALGLTAGLQSLVNKWNRLGKTHYQLTISGDSRRLPDAMQLTLFRIIQEGINNIAKHAQASQAEIALLIDSDQIVLRIQDNGIALALPFAEGLGIGLLGIRERVTALSGQFNLQIAQPQGLQLSVCLPFAKAAKP